MLFRSGGVGAELAEVLERALVVAAVLDLDPEVLLVLPVPLSEPHGMFKVPRLPTDADRSLEVERRLLGRCAAVAVGQRDRQR